MGTTLTNSQLAGRLAVQLSIVVGLWAIAKGRSARNTWDGKKASRIQWLCGAYLVLLYGADFGGFSPGVGVLAYPFAVYYLCLSSYRKRDLRRMTDTIEKPRREPGPM
jgi:hypothetical protein